MARDRSRVGGCVHRRRGGLAHPDRYQSTAKLYVDTQSVPAADGGPGISADLDQQVRMLARTLISRPNIEASRRRSRAGLSAVAPPSARRSSTT